MKFLFIPVRHWKTILLVLFVLIIIILLYDGCEQRRRADQLVNAFQKDSVAFVTELDKNKKIINVQRQKIMNQDDAIATGALEIQNLNVKNVKMQTKVKEMFSINEKIQIRHTTDTQFVPFYIKPAAVAGCKNCFDVIPEDYALVDTSKVLRVPATFTKSDTLNYGITGTIDKDSISVESFFISRSKITVADKKIGFLRPAKPSVIYQNENPKAIVLDMNNVVIVEPKPWYNRKGLWFLFGLITSYFIFK